MWAINSITLNTLPEENATFTDGKPLYAVRGGTGTSYRLVVMGLGFLDFIDTGHQPGGPSYWQLIIADHPYWYDGQGAIDLTIDNYGSVSVSGDGNHLVVGLEPFPSVSQHDVDRFDWMMNNDYIPYQNIPDEPGKTREQIRKLGDQYFPYSENSLELAMSLYDWTTADFTRIDFMNLFTYTDVANMPLDKNSIANGIWNANWPPYTPHNADYMNSFMMVPANSLQDVKRQLDEVASTLRVNNTSECNIINAALNGMPRTSCISVPKLYSGQVAISNLGSEHLATYFLQLPENSDPSLPPLQMDLEKALNTFMAVGKNITLKSFLSFTDSFKDAQHYSNGIVLIVNPPDGAAKWEQATYITPLSDGPEKTEYLFKPGTMFQVLKIQKVSVNGSQITEIYLQVLNDIGGGIGDQQ